MDHPATRSRKKLQKVYVLMSQQTRGRLKLVAGFKSMRLFDLIETLSTDYIRGWEKLNKIDLDKLQDAETKRSGNTRQAVQSLVAAYSGLINPRRTARAIARVRPRTPSFLEAFVRWKLTVAMLIVSS